MITKEKKIRYISLDHDRKEMVINSNQQLKIKKMNAMASLPSE